MKKVTKIIVILIVVVGIISAGYYVYDSHKSEDGINAYLEDESPNYDVGQWLPEDGATFRDISITITNIDEFNLPENNGIQNDLNYFASMSNYFTESGTIELEYVNKVSEYEYEFKFKNCNLYGSYTDQAFISNFWEK